MLIRHYTLRFNTPAFLGNADQTGQWRTPPIKALLRQWWRVAYAAGQHGAVHLDTMRTEEGGLFGVAADRDGESRKSQVRIRLSHWGIGKLGSFDRLEQAPVRHPDAERTAYQVGPLAYLGYGPLDGRAGTRLSEKCNAAVNSDERAQLSLAFPAGADGGRLDSALALMHFFGTLGGRSRNGWGSFSLTPADALTPALRIDLDARLTAPWKDALAHDWPHAIGRDAQGPLIWQTAALADWKAVMRRLAEIKIDLRTQQAFTFNSGKNAPRPEARHWLSYPVTNHSVRDWGTARLPNSLRFKVRTDPDGKLRGVIFHVPSRPPPQFKPERPVLADVWRQVHDFLDQHAKGLQRIAA